jgi:hypothetical protein
LSSREDEVCVGYGNHRFRPGSGNREEESYRQQRRAQPGR